MLFIAPVKESRWLSLPENYQEMDLWEKLYTPRSDIHSITHVDFSVRIQSVHKNTNNSYWELINAFYARTGYGLLVNTSFYVRGEPIVCLPDDAYKCFMNTEMDFLVLGHLVLQKNKSA